MIRAISLVLALSASAALAAAQPAPGSDLAQSRLNGCLLAGSSAATGPDLRTAVIEVRAFCGAQIARVRKDRVATARRGLKGDAAREAEDRAVRALNDEIALAVSNFTGLTL